VAGLALCGDKENSCWVAQGQQGRAERWRHRCNVVAETGEVLRGAGRDAGCTARRVLTVGESGLEGNPSRLCGARTEAQLHGSAPVGWRSGAGPGPNEVLPRTSSGVVGHLGERPSCGGQGLVESVEGRPSDLVGQGCSSLH